ncbi:hypothetical protein CAPTEDRAFT_212664 [Capitella teleta]|uniref:Uncharacterized protein n=1 Tax=Capitella teleta TaxID=283909 RepID=R7UYH6_CAPTE|nr:hypothetical protein CAPTEDRAFT_212664 [Capitella teleta]|eukprot:ELU11618.1 hypothetical protein CAPTEDRAFT_212664 [Capitella teleta]
MSYPEGITASRKQAIHKISLLNFKLQGGVFHYIETRWIGNEVPASQPSTSASMEVPKAEEWRSVVIDENEMEIILHEKFTQQKEVYLHLNKMMLYPITRSHLCQDKIKRNFLN